MLSLRLTQIHYMREMGERYLIVQLVGDTTAISSIELYYIL